MTPSLAHTATAIALDAWYELWLACWGWQRVQRRPIVNRT
jgi:hypothetical protein